MPLAASFKAIGQSQGLGNFFGGGNQVNFQGRIQGNDILLGNLRSGTNLGRIGG
jgi:hypothetical protein